MTTSSAEHELNDLFAWACRKHSEATETTSFHGELTMKVTYANGKLVLFDRALSEKFKPTK